MATASNRTTANLNRPKHAFNTHYDDSHQNGPSTSQILAVVILLPLGLLLLGIAGVTFVATIITLAVATPLFVIFSPIIVPAGLAIAFAVAGFLTSGALGVTGLSSISWLVEYVRRVGVLPAVREKEKWEAQNSAAFLGQRVKDAAGEQGYADDRAIPRRNVIA